MKVSFKFDGAFSKLKRTCQVIIFNPIMLDEVAI